MITPNTNMVEYLERFETACIAFDIPNEVRWWQLIHYFDLELTERYIKIVESADFMDYERTKAWLLTGCILLTQRLSTDPVRSEHDIFDTFFLEIRPIDTAITGIKQTAAIDSGSSIDIINANTITKEQQEMIQRSQPFYVRTANGAVKIDACLETTLILDNCEEGIKVQWFIIKDLPYDYVIGRPTWRKLLHIAHKHKLGSIKSGTV